MQRQLALYSAKLAISPCVHSSIYVDKMASGSNRFRSPKNRRGIFLEGGAKLT